MPHPDEMRIADGPMSAAPREPLAVIGIGCRLPGGVTSPASFWRELMRGFDGICAVPHDRWRHARFHDTNPEKFGAIRNAMGGFIEGVDEFDAEFFGYFPNEAQRMDPQQRILLEVTHEALEDAGLRRDQVDGTRTSVFIGSFMYDYLCIQAATEQRDEINPYVAMGCAVSPLSNRISYDFNLKGPSATVDTACSSSLVALHLACRSLWNGEAEMAIAGGVNVMLRPESSIMLSKAGFLNPDQYCKAFDASANGYVRGEGAGIVILKPLTRALADGDDIYACVRGSGVNQDGYQPEGFTVPNMMSQIELLKAVYSEAGIDPLKVDYVEAHGTGTPVGDPIESLSLGAVLGRDRAAGDRCLIGSVKTNIGHLEGASGIAGFIKAALTARHGIVPPNRHFHEPNPEIDWLNLRLEVPTEVTELKRHGRAWTIGVNSFGAGGTNAHVVLESPPPRVEPTTSPAAIPADIKSHPWAESTLYFLSATNRESLRTMARRHAEHLSSTDANLADMACSAFQRRSRYPHFLAAVGSTREQISEQLRGFADGQLDAAVLSQVISPSKKPKIGWIFSGQGGQWAEMGSGLLRREPVFRYWMEEVDAYFQKLSNWSLIAEVRRPAPESRIDETIVVQPTVMAVQIALAKLYEHYGIHPDGIVGHSIGEVAAAYISGALSMEDAVQVIYHRSRVQSRAEGRGGMLAVGLSLDEVRKLLRPYEGQVSIGAVNGPEMLTVSGDREPLAQIRSELEARGVFARPVRVQVAYHSHHMEPLRHEMLESLNRVRGVKSKIPLYSTVSGRRESGAHLDAEYWYRNVREPVWFTDTLAKMLQNQFDTFIEIGPHPVLISGAESLIKQLDADAVVGAAMRRRECETTVFLHSLARLAARGAQPTAERLYGRGRRFVRLPQYPWQQSKYWFELPAVTEQRLGAYEHPFLRRQTPLVTEPGIAVWEASLESDRFPYLRDHRVDGETVFPATGHVELAWAAAHEQFRQESLFLEDLHFELPLILPEQSRYPLTVRLEIVSNEGEYRICSRAADAAPDSPWTRHSSGRINTLFDDCLRSDLSLADVRKRFANVEAMSPAGFYDAIRDAGLDYGTTFRAIQTIQRRDRSLLARLELPEEARQEGTRYFFHPALLDACLHVFFAEVHEFAGRDRIYLPHHIERVKIFARPSHQVWSFVQATHIDDDSVRFDTLIFDEAGTVIAELQGLTCKRLANGAAGTVRNTYDGCYEYRWTEAARDESSYAPVGDYTRAVVCAPPQPSAPVASFLDGIASRFVEAKIPINVVTLAHGDESLDWLDDLTLDRRTLIVFAAGLSAPPFHWRNLDDCPSVASWLHLVRRIRQRDGVPRLILLTNGAAGVEGDSSFDLGQSILHGMSRVMRNECPNMALTVVDVDADLPARQAERTTREWLSIRPDCDESEIAIRGDRRLVLRLAPVDQESAEAQATRHLPARGGAYRAEAGRIAGIEHIDFRQRQASPLGPQEVEIEIAAAGLNFKDIMNGMMLLPRRAVAGGLAGERLGLEVAGRVVNVGGQVTDVTAGDQVLARVADGFGGLAKAPVSSVVRMPSNLTMAQGAAIPVVFLTAWYGLHHLARMEPGELVLVHSAAGGVGNAAIQLARRRGARVIATAGTKDRRDFALQLGAEHAFDSRSLDFVNHVREVTDGRGVDIVVNSLSGRSLLQSVRCLAPFGRFIELGKSDIYRNSRIGLQHLGENISLFVVDVDRLAVQKPELHQRLFREVIDLFERGELTPPEITEFPVTRLRDAMKQMLRSSYRGKIVVSMGEETVAALPPRHAQFRADRSYLITGGASGLGLEIAAWMADRGARHLWLVSRQGVKDEEARRRVESLRARGVAVEIRCVDITDADAVRRLIADLPASSPRLGGVIHGAAVLDDASLANMDMERFRRVFAPKAQGAWVLHEALQDAGVELDFFVMISSISAVLGIVGQLNYAAANHFQDCLARYRQSLGLCATAVNLGLLGQYAGMSRKERDSRDVVSLLESQGLHVMPLNDVLSKLEAALVQQPAQRMASRVDWRQFRTAYPQLARDTRFLAMMSDASLSSGGSRGSTNLRSVLTNLSTDERRDRLQQELAGKLARILDATPEQIDTTTTLDAFGLDSLMLTDLQVWIARLLDVNVPLIKLLRGPSLARLTDDLLADLSDAQHTSGDGKTSISATLPAQSIVDLDGISVVDRWLLRGASAKQPACRLLCFHSMGVGASLFTSFLLNPPDGLDVLAVQGPGRENRALDAPVDSVEELLDQLTPKLLPLLDLPMIIWGHSFGGIVAYEAVRRLRSRHHWEPAHLLVTGTAAPHLMCHWQKRDVMLKAMVEDNSPEYLVSLSRYVDDVPFLKSIIPLMRRDWPLLKNYRFEKSEPLGCPITALAARRDEMAYPDEIRAWQTYTKSAFHLAEVEGDHWFLNRNREFILALLRDLALACGRGDTDANVDDLQETTGGTSP